MHLFLLRHGDAEQRSVTGRDQDRVLSQEGMVRLHRTLRLARAAGTRPSLILASPYLRAVQTAEIAARELGYSGQILHSSSFGPDSSPFRVWEEVRVHQEESAILIAAHEPLLSSTVAWFAGSTRVMVRFVPAALVRIDFEDPGPHPQGVMQWMITPELVGE